MIFCRIWRLLAWAARMWRRISASSGLAASAMVSSSGIQRLMVSSRKRFPWRDKNKWSIAVFSVRSSPEKYSLARRAAVSRSAMLSSSRVFRLPPRSARSSASATGLTPEKEGLPRRPIIARAASVWSSSRSASSASVSGRMRRHRAFPSALTACSESSCSTLGSSRVRMDFSNCSLILRSPVKRFHLMVIHRYRDWACSGPRASHG